LSELYGSLFSKELDADLDVPEGNLSDFFHIIGKTLNHNGQEFREVLNELVERGSKEDHDASVSLSDVGLRILRL